MARALQRRTSLCDRARALAQVPRALREELAARGWRTGRAREHARVAAADGTLKLLLQLADGRLVEAVGIPERDVAPTGDAGKNRLTACISSQARAGCSMFLLLASGAAGLETV